VASVSKCAHTATQAERTHLASHACVPWLCVLFVPACVHRSGSVHEMDANERVDDAKRQQLDHMGPALVLGVRSARGDGRRVRG
jgi:hypothetical protein